jgi:hypothetical protein
MSAPYVASPEPEFEAKAAEIPGLYFNPPSHAVVLCMDEKSHIQRRIGLTSPQ